MKIFDCFLFNNEIELLELRISETQDVVDKWVLIESPINFKHGRKPLFFEENKRIFEPYLSRIHHVIVNNMPSGLYKTEEFFQRRQLQPAWEAAGAREGDLIIMSDVDEIPSAATIKNLSQNPPPKPISLKQHLFYYTVNWRQNQMWNGPVIFQLKNEPVDVQELRDSRYDIPVVEAGGWHFSWLGPVESIQHKLDCYDIAKESKGELKDPDRDNIQFIEECLSSGKDIFGRSDKLAQKTFVEIDPGGLHPLAIGQWLKKYPYFARQNTGSPMIDHQGAV